MKERFNLIKASNILSVYAFCLYLLLDSTDESNYHRYTRSVFALPFTPESPNSQSRRDEQSKRRSLSCSVMSIHTKNVNPDISYETWMWTVCFEIRRLAMPGVRQTNQRSTSSFFIVYPRP